MFSNLLVDLEIEVLRVRMAPGESGTEATVSVSDQASHQEKEFLLRRPSCYVKRLSVIVLGPRLGYSHVNVI